LLRAVCTLVQFLDIPYLKFLRMFQWIVASQAAAIVGGIILLSMALQHMHGELYRLGPCRCFKGCAKSTAFAGPGRVPHGSFLGMFQPRSVDVCDGRVLANFEEHSDKRNQYFSTQGFLLSQEHCAFLGMQFSVGVHRSEARPAQSQLIAHIPGSCVQWHSKDMISAVLGKY
jgi:hypothetical protein